MHSAFHLDDNPLIRKLDSIFTLDSAERQALENLPMQILPIRENQDIVREGDSPSRCCVILSGFACTYKVTDEGKRQIVAFNIAGDIPDLQSLHLEVLDNGIGTLTPCRVGFIAHDDLREICNRHPRITNALWRETLVDAAIFREWMTSIGRRDAYRRIAHLLCELLVRLNAIGLAEGHACELPITQGEFADALGISTVHINRVVQQLRAEGLIELKGDRLNILNWDRLKKAGEFHPVYLHLKRKHVSL